MYTNAAAATRKSPETYCAGACRRPAVRGILMHT